jgi:hypothetical protein
MASIRTRLAVIAAGAVMATQSGASSALAAPDVGLLPVMPDALFQNACVQNREERERALEEGREAEDLADANVPRWRRVFSSSNSYGPVVHTGCYFNDSSESDPPRRR